MHTLFCSMAILITLVLSATKGASYHLKKWALLKKRAFALSRGSS